MDINVEEWYAYSGNKHKKWIETQKEKIITVLEELNINHGHPNNGNFCLRFDRDDSGEVDINVPPRVYIIDFDKASPIRI